MKWDEQKDTRGRATPTGGAVGVLYDLPAQRVGTADEFRQPVQKITVGEAVDVLNRLPAQYFRQDRQTYLPQAVVVVPGRPFPRFRFNGF